MHTLLYNKELTAFELRMNTTEFVLDISSADTEYQIFQPGSVEHKTREYFPPFLNFPFPPYVIPPSQSKWRPRHGNIFIFIKKVKIKRDDDFCCKIPFGIYNCENTG